MRGEAMPTREAILQALEIRMTTTAPGCPVGDFIGAEVGRVVRELGGVEDVRVEFVRDPPWSPEMITEEGKRMLGIA